MNTKKELFLRFIDTLNLTSRQKNVVENWLNDDEKIPSLQYALEKLITIYDDNRNPKFKWSEIVDLVNLYHSYSEDVIKTITNNIYAICYNSPNLRYEDIKDYVNLVTKYADVSQNSKITYLFSFLFSLIQIVNEKNRQMILNNKDISFIFKKYAENDNITIFGQLIHTLLSFKDEKDDFRFSLNQVIKLVDCVIETESYLDDTEELKRTIQFIYTLIDTYNECNYRFSFDEIYDLVKFRAGQKYRENFDSLFEGFIGIYDDVQKRYLNFNEIKLLLKLSVPILRRMPKKSEQYINEIKKLLLDNYDDKKNRLFDLEYLVDKLSDLFERQVFNDKQVIQIVRGLNILIRIYNDKTKKLLYDIDTAFRLVETYAYSGLDANEMALLRNFIYKASLIFDKNDIHFGVDIIIRITSRLKEFHSFYNIDKVNYLKVSYVKEMVIELLKKEEYIDKPFIILNLLSYLKKFKWVDDIKIMTDFIVLLSNISIKKEDKEDSELFSFSVFDVQKIISIFADNLDKIDTTDKLRYITENIIIWGRKYDKKKNKIVFSLDEMINKIEKIINKK